MGSRVDESQSVELGPADTDAEKSKTVSEEDPWDPENRAYLIVETANVTSLVTNQEQMHNRKAHVVAIQEHVVSGKEASIAVRDAKERGWDLILGPVDPELARKTGGVGFQSAKNISVLPIRSKTEDYEDAEKTGRLKIIEV